MKKILFIAVCALLSNFVLAQQHGEVNCRDLSSSDSQTLCQQNNRIIRMLRNGGSNGANLKVCTVTYCYYTSQNCAEGANYRSYCDQNGSFWYYKTVEVEARNRVDARQVFADSGMVTACAYNGSTLEGSFESAVCDD